MEDMKYDMGGADSYWFDETLAYVSKVNAVGVLDQLKYGRWKCSKPGDVVKVIQDIIEFNTDAEGRLVLADAIAYTEDKFNQIYNNLATLTGQLQQRLQ